MAFRRVQRLADVDFGALPADVRAEVGAFAQRDRFNMLEARGYPADEMAKLAALYPRGRAWTREQVRDFVLREDPKILLLRELDYLWEDIRSGQGMDQMFFRGMVPQSFPDRDSVSNALQDKDWKLVRYLRYAPLPAASQMLLFGYINNAVIISPGVDKRFIRSVYRTALRRTPNARIGAEIEDASADYFRALLALRSEFPEMKIAGRVRTYSDVAQEDIERIVRHWEIEEVYDVRHPDIPRRLPRDPRVLMGPQLKVYMSVFEIWRAP